MQLADFSVEGRSVLLTGAGRGIGLAVARGLAAGGARVAIQDIDLAVAQAEADVINAEAMTAGAANGGAKTGGKRAIALGGDLTDLSLPDQLMASAVEQFGRVDILINNGSVQRAKPFVEHTFEDMQRELNANILAAIRLCQLALPPMQAAGWGRVINFGSIQGKSGNDHMPVYAMSRAAMSNLTRGLARQYGQHGITVNCIAPGWTATQRTAKDFKDDEDKAKKGKWIPVGRVGEPEDFVGIIQLLCSQAGEYITGQTIHVDGGMSLK